MSEEKDVLRRLNNVEARVKGHDVQIDGIYKLVTTIQDLCKALIETKLNRGAPLTEDIPVGIVSIVEWPVLEAGKYVPSLKGTIVDDIVIREVQVREKPTPIANFEFTDGVTVVRVAVWDELICELEGLSKGDTLTMTSISVKKPYEGMQQISTTRNTTIE